MAKIMITAPEWAENIERATEKKEDEKVLCVICGKRYTTKNVCSECLRRIKRYGSPVQKVEAEKVYIAGKITGDDNYREKFARMAKTLEKQGFTVMNPAVLPWGFDHHEYLHINKAMIDVCDSVVFLMDWQDSKGAKIEHDYASQAKKTIGYEAEVRLGEVIVGRVIEWGLGRTL